MYRPKFNQSFDHMSDTKFVKLCQEIIEGVTDNEFYPKAVEPLAEFKAVFDKFFLSIPTPSTRNEINTAAKDLNRLECNNALFLFVAFLTYESNFNKEAMKSTNVPMNTPPQPKGLVGLVQDLNLVTNGERDLVIVSCKMDPNASKYYVRVSRDEENWFAFAVNTSRKVKVKNLPIGEKLYFQMQLENKNGTSPWSRSVTGRIAEQDVIASMHK